MRNRILAALGAAVVVLLAVGASLALACNTPPPTCGTENQPACQPPPCGTENQPACPVPPCGTEGQPACPVPPTPPTPPATPVPPTPPPAATTPAPPVAVTPKLAPAIHRTVKPTPHRCAAGRGRVHVKDAHGRRITLCRHARPPVVRSPQFTG